MKTKIILLMLIFASCSKEPNRREYFIEGANLTINGNEYQNQALFVIAEGESMNIKCEGLYNTATRLKISSNGFIYVNLQGGQNEILTINFKYQ